MKNQKIKIRLKSFDHKLLDRSAKEIIFSARRTGAEISGPIPLPRKIERFTVNKSPHVDKRSREQFEFRTQKRLVVIDFPTAQTVDALKKIDLAPGIDVDIELVG